MSSNGGSRSQYGYADKPTKRARKLTEADLGGTIEDEETAKQKLSDAGFDLDDPDVFSSYSWGRRPGRNRSWYVTPIFHFCAAGDLKMVRYLVSKGIPTVRADASSDDDDDDDDVDSIDTDLRSPMQMALRNGHVHVCEWLFEHGAREEVQNDAYVVGYVGYVNLLRTAFNAWKEGRGSNTPRWLVLNGALSNHDGSPNKKAMEAIESYGGAASDFRMLLTWAQETLQTNRNVQFILLGSLLPRDYSVSALHQCLSGGLKSNEAADFLMNELLSAEKCRELWKKLPFSKRSSPLQILCGKAGVFELIADFSGFIRSTNMVSTLQGIIGPLERALHRAKVMTDPDDDYGDEISYIEEAENDY